MQVDIFHRNNLGITAAGRATLHAKTRPKRWFTQTNHGILANGIQTITKTNSCCCLTFTSRCWVNRCHKNQFIIWVLWLRFNPSKIDFCLIMAKGLKSLCRDIQLVANFKNRFGSGSSGNFDVAHILLSGLFKLVGFHILALCPL